MLCTERYMCIWSRVTFYFCLQSVQFSRSVVSDSLRPHESQNAMPPCPSPTPGFCLQLCCLTYAAVYVLLFFVTIKVVFCTQDLVPSNWKTSFYIFFNYLISYWFTNRYALQDFFRKIFLFYFLYFLHLTDSLPIKPLSNIISPLTLPEKGNKLPNIQNAC